MHMISTAKESIATALKNGELVVLPTDTIFGIVADAKNKQAVIPACMPTYKHACLHIHINMYTHMYAYMHTSYHTYTYADMHIYIHVCINTFMHATSHIYKHTYL